MKFALALSLLVACSPAAPQPKPAVRRQGCGKAHQESGDFRVLSIEAAGQQRTYAFFAPADYDPNRRYPLIFRFHGHGGARDSGGLEIDRASQGAALIVSPDGLPSHDGKTQSWSPRNQDADLALFDALLERTESEYCIDTRRVFAYGFSAGGGFSQALACARGEVLRAVGTIAANRAAGERCRGTVSAYLRYDENDPAVPLRTGIGARDALLARDGCSAAMTQDGACQLYTQCSTNERVRWCVGSSPAESAHDPGGVRVAAEVWSFFRELR